MRLYDIAFFCERGKSPKLSINTDQNNTSWKHSLHFTSDGKSHSTPRVTFYLVDSQELAVFADRLNQEVEKALEGSDYE